MLAGLIRDDERSTLAGVPGLTDLPLIGRLFARNQTEAQQTDILLVLTPHIIRVLDLTENDLRPFRVGREASGGGAVIDLPTTPAQPPPAELPENLPAGMVPPPAPDRRLVHHDAAAAGHGGAAGVPAGATEEAAAVVLGPSVVRRRSAVVRVPGPSSPSAREP